MGPQDSSGVYRFDEFRLDPVHGTVLGPDGAELRLRPKTFALLRHLLDNPGRLLGREELLETLWPGLTVTDDSLTQCVSDLRHAFADQAPQVLRTVPKRGYMLIAEVRRDDPPRSYAAHAATRLTSVLVPTHDVVGLREDPVTVHRLDTPDGDSACVLLAEALAADLTVAGTRIEGVRILPAADVDVRRLPCQGRSARRRYGTPRYAAA